MDVSKYNLLSILSGSGTGFEITKALDIQSDERLSRLMESWKMSWDPRRIVGTDGIAGHVDAYSISDTTITMIVVMKAPYHKTSRVLALALAHEIVEKTYGETYKVISKVVCFESMGAGVRQITPHSLLNLEAREILKS